MPFDHEGNLLLPATSMSHELWPMLLTKALLKVAALESVNTHVYYYTKMDCYSRQQCDVLPKITLEIVIFPGGFKVMQINGK